MLAINICIKDLSYQTYEKKSMNILLENKQSILMCIFLLH